MTFTQKLLTTAAFLLFPLSAAAAPTNVSRVEARIVNGTLTVLWTPSQDAVGIDFYRIYFSHESILDHQGNYDDSVRTQGSETTYVFPSLPLSSPTITVSVLAVNKQGVESEGFETEATVSVATSSAPSVQTASQTGTAVPVTSVPMAVKEVRAVSATGILVLFTKPVPESFAAQPTYVSVVDGSGKTLDITNVTLSGGGILLHSTMQKEGERYALSILQPIPAADGTNLPTGNERTTFDAFRMTIPVASSMSSSMNSSEIPYVKNPALTQPVPEKKNPPEDPVNLALKAMRRADGTYTVVANWGASPDSQRSLSSYVLSVSSDGERFEKNSIVDRDHTAVQYDRIPAGVFGVLVASKDAAGNESAGIRKVITLPESGVGLLGIAAVSGMLAGKRVRRKK